MSRFFAFGCSFTQNNSRPTWADIIGREFEEYQNWGRPGAGNQYIFNQLIECHARNKFTANDTVYIMWTSVSREDRYVKDRWIGGGNIYNQNIYPESWVKQFACERGYLIRDLATISAARDLLRYWGVKYRFFAMIPVINPNESHEELPADTNNQDVIALYQDVLSEINPSVYEVVFNSQNWNDKKSTFGAWVDDNIRDPHPDPTEALEYVEKIMPEIKLSQATIDYVNKFKLGDVVNSNKLKNGRL